MEVTGKYLVEQKSKITGKNGRRDQLRMAVCCNDEFLFLDAFHPSALYYFYHCLYDNWTMGTRSGEKPSHCISMLDIEGKLKCIHKSSAVLCFLQHYH